MPGTVGCAAAETVSDSNAVTRQQSGSKTSISETQESAQETFISETQESAQERRADAQLEIQTASKGGFLDGVKVKSEIHRSCKKSLSSLSLKRSRSDIMGLLVTRLLWNNTERTQSTQICL